MTGINFGKIHKKNIANETTDVLQDIVGLGFKRMLVEIGVNEEFFDADEYYQSKEHIHPIEPRAKMCKSKADQDMRYKMCTRVCIE